MYEDYTRQALPSKYYRELLGSAMCVFNSNNAFIIENILKKDKENKYDWYKLIDKTSGQLKSVLEDILRPLQNSSYNLSFLNIFCTFMV